MIELNGTWTKNKEYNNIALFVYIHVCVHFRTEFNEVCRNFYKL